MKKLIPLLGVTGVHFLITRGIIALTEAKVAARTFDDPSALSSVILVTLTKILSFPIITLSLYSRQWYPGNLIYIPFLVNSLLWAAAIVFPLAWILKRRSR